MIVACRMPPCHLPRCILIRPSRVCWLQHSGSLHKRGQIVTWRWTPGFYVLCENTLHEFAGAMPMPLLLACSPTCTSLIARVRVLYMSGHSRRGSSPLSCAQTSRSLRRLSRHGPFLLHTRGGVHLRIEHTTIRWRSLSLRTLAPS